MPVSFRALPPVRRAARASRFATFILAIVLLAPAPVIMANPLMSVPVAEQRVRASDTYLRGVLALAAEKSQTIRDLISELQRSNVIVHVCPRMPEGSDMISGSLQYVGTHGGQRYLRIRVRLDLVQPQLIALIGHELQHAFEVASSPAVVDAASMERLYRRIGFPKGTHRHETLGAQHVEDRILRELAAPMRAD
jgi:hypothetical protein